MEVAAGRPRPWIVAVAVLAGCGADPAGPPSSRLALLEGAGQVGIAGDPLPVPFAVQLLDAGGGPAAGVPVTITPGHGGSVSSAAPVTDLIGVVRFGWTLGPDAPGRQELTVRAADATPLAITAGAVHPDQADVLVQTGTEPVDGIAVAYDGEGFRSGVAMALQSTSPARRMVPLDPPESFDELMAMAPGRAPTIVRPRWTSGRDTARLALGPPVELPVAVWIAVPDSVMSPVTAAEHLADTDRILRRAGVALRWSAADIGYTRHPSIYDREVAPCSRADGVEVTPGRINVYLVRDVTGFSGHACGGFVYVQADRSRGTLIGHELGHELNLGHEGPAANLMALPPGDRLTLGQIFRIHFHAYSALNYRFQVRPVDQVRDCNQPVVFGVSGEAITRCPPTSYDPPTAR